MVLLRRYVEIYSSPDGYHCCSSAYVNLEYSRDGWIVYCEPAVGISHLVKTRKWTGLQRAGRSEVGFPELDHLN